VNRVGNFTQGRNEILNDGRGSIARSSLVFFFASSREVRAESSRAQRGLGVAVVIAMLLDQLAGSRQSRPVAEQAGKYNSCTITDRCASHGARDGGLTV
jgi:hypothetical protein